MTLAVRDAVVVSAFDHNNMCSVFPTIVHLGKNWTNLCKKHKQMRNVIDSFSNIR